MSTNFMVIIIAKSPLSIYFSTFLYTVVIIENDSSAIGMRADKKKGGKASPLRFDPFRQDLLLELPSRFTACYLVNYFGSPVARGFPGVVLHSYQPPS